MNIALKALKCSYRPWKTIVEFIKIDVLNGAVYDCWEIKITNTHADLFLIAEIKNIKHEGMNKKETYILIAEEKTTETYDVL